jgi:hypothetical protein
METQDMLRVISDPRFALALAAVQDQSSVQRRLAQLKAGIPMLKDDWTTTDADLANPTIYGRHSIFDPCSNGDVFGLQVATHGLMNWLGWRANPYWKRTVQFITWWRGEGADEGISGAGSPCEDPLSWEWGECSYELCHTSWYHRQGQPLGPHNTQIRCENSPRTRINGTVIDSDWEWQLNGVLNALKQDITHDAIHGSHLNDYEMNGLESVIRTGYADNNGNNCPMVDAWLVDWDFDDLDGAVNGWGNFFDFLNELVNQIEYRAQALGDIAEQDMVLYTQRFMADCILDAFACYSVCGVTTTNDRTEQSLRAQILAYRNSLNGGPLYDGSRAVGFIRLKNGRRLPIMVDDAFTITHPNANYCTDVYLLTRQIGGNAVLYGEYLDLGDYQNQMRKFDPGTQIAVEQGGRFAFRGKMDNWCGTVMVGTSPELYLSAPWAQARIMDVCCERKLVPVVGDPFQDDYLPGGGGMYPASEWGMDCTDTPVAGTQTPVVPRQ